MDTKYNGWTNYATWRVHLEIFSEFEDEFFGEGVSAEWCEDYAYTLVVEDPGCSGLAADYAGAFLAEVNYYEIAEHLNELIKD